MPTTPIIFETGNIFNPNTPSAPSFIKKWLPKIIYLLFGLVIIGLLYWSYKTLTAPIPKIATVAPLTGGKIELIPTQETYKVGDEVMVTIRLNTGGWTTDGSDVFIKYDPNKLEAQASGAQISFKKGIIYQEYPVISIDQAAGIIQASGIAVATSNQKGFNGIDTFGILVFKAKAAGTTKLQVDFQKDNTEDSNIIETSSSQDILEEVTNAEIKIQ